MRTYKGHRRIFDLLTSDPEHGYTIKQVHQCVSDLSFETVKIYLNQLSRNGKILRQRIGKTSYFLSNS